MYFGGNLKHFYAHMTALGACQPKALEAICFDRLMTGSRENLRREAGMIDKMTSMLGRDGLYWVQEHLTHTANPAGSPTFHRPIYEAGKVPMKNVERFVTEKTLKW